MDLSNKNITNKSDTFFDEIEILPDAVELFEKKVESYDEIELLLDTVEILPDEIEVYNEIIVSEEKEIFSDKIIVLDEKELFSAEIRVPEEIEAIIPDDKIRIIEELDDQNIFFIDEKTFIQKMVDGEGFDYFAQKKTQTKSEKPSILGLIPEENDYIKDKLFGEYYRMSGLHTDIDIDKINASGAINDASKLSDITDDIIILEDKEEMLELTAKFPGKGDRLVKLLSYLDGLFEKLPEGVIRKFAESEYFELYSKILRDIERLGKKKNESL